ncbi:MAG: hypothetical protein APF84_10595 [Gracilibacter sp. BRH_c7a]|nr:MAG: hypothetical protein APF84_10595 [Gracilibacter sp. BRH_c7a]
MTTNTLTIDIEDWYHTEFFQNKFSYKEWDNLSSVVPAAIDFILPFLRERNIKATFFVLGYIAERFPDVVDNLIGAGHEIACHGYSHTFVSKMSCKEFKIDVQKSLDILKKSRDIDIMGFRAPACSITDRESWFFPVLKENGFRYDSSIYPNSFLVLTKRKNSKYTAWNVFEDLWEIPLTSYKLFSNIGIPLSGAFYFRLIPFFIYKYLVSNLNKKDIPLNIYIHPREICEDFPIIKQSMLADLVHYWKIGRPLTNKLDKLTNKFNFISVSEAYFNSDGSFKGNNI